MQKLIDLQQGVYEANKAKGFWDDAERRNKGEAIALLVSETYESLEGHRKGRDFNAWEPVVLSTIRTSLSFVDLDNENQVQQYKSVFERYVKDTWQDELADAVIRLLDYTGGFGIKLIADNRAAIRQVLPKNFGEAILQINERILNVFFSKSEEWRIKGWSYVLDDLYYLAQREGCNLYQHVIWKLKYNTMREHKHGKKY